MLLYDAVLAGGTPSLGALRAQMGTPAWQGVSRNAYRNFYDLATVQQVEGANRKYLLSGRPDLDIDDVRVTVAELAEPLDVLAVVRAGILSVVRLSPAPATGWPRRLIPTSARYVLADGSLSAHRDSSVLSRYEAALSEPPSGGTETPPAWLQPLGANALRPYPRPGPSSGDVALLGRWVDACTFGHVTLLSGDEHYDLEGGVVIAQDADGSPYIACGRTVRQVHLDGTSTTVATSLRKWVQALAKTAW